ncbi:MAG: hypothetical protein ABI442_16640 [Gemmatimonadaceae bacterium]
MPFPARLRALLSPLICFAIACGGGGGETTTPPVTITDPPANVTIFPASPVTISGGGSVTISVSVTTKTGAVISNPTITFTSTDSSVATVFGNAIAGFHVGTATIMAIATASNGSARASISVTVVPGTPTNLAIRTQPVATATYSLFSVQPMVEVHDFAGNLVPTSNAPVTVVILTGAGTLGGTRTVNAVNGVATFTDLIISGNTGIRTLTFTAPGLAGVNASPITLGPPVAPLVVLDSTSVSLSGQVGSSPSPATLRISNGGQTPFAPPSVDLISYDAGQPTGWLTTSITGTVAPFTLTIQPSTAALPAGTYHASVRISVPGALNTPATVSVTVKLVPSFTVAFGSTTDKVKLTDPATSLVALTTVLGGVTQTPSVVSFVSRATSVATVNAAGVISAAGGGESWVVASEAGLSDSVFVIVANNTAGPALRTDLTTYAANAGDVAVVNFTLDPRATAVAGATVVVGYETENGMFTLQSARVPIQTPQPVTSASSPGVYKVNVASATALAGPVTMLQLTLRENASGLAGWLTFTILDAVGPDGSDVAPKVTSTRYPVIIK